MVVPPVGSAEHCTAKCTIQLACHSACDMWSGITGNGCAKCAAGQ